MSCQRGNSSRSRPQKYQNATKFKNTLHDCSKQTQMLNSLDISGVCLRCKDQIEWKIRYKKYKPLTVPKKCVKCEQKNVLRAYTVACEPCGAKLNVCVKCLEKKELVQRDHLTHEEESRQQQQLDADLKLLSERARRTFLRNLEQGKFSEKDLSQSVSKHEANSEAQSDGSGDPSDYDEESDGYESPE